MGKTRTNAVVFRHGLTRINTVKTYFSVSSVLSVAIVTVCLLSGCAKRQQFEPKPVCLAGTDAKLAMAEAEKVLIRMNFVVDKIDPNSGVMRTKPLTGGQFFELWRKDNRSSYSRNMANIHTIRRTAELQFAQENEQMCINCNVKVERLSVPEKEIDSSSRVYSLFSDSDSSSQRMQLNAEQKRKSEWVDIGRDNGLEDYILTKVNKQISKTKGKR
ncbi:MAG: hypothetical protein PHP01_02795 [Phycisphaerae bacterium]|nr:hypothetical protein [Phycisphaerae bacterium]